ncbi:MAG: 3-hydroxyacyl-CoA dehydrogenase family protein [Roseinatronobacter sp.]|nr:3-hydroxyacyl-CoA dehydrogenase family protein [Roseinatronobacter sp.]
MIDHIGIIGAGTMGAGIMIGAVMSGVTVTLIDRDIAACARAAKRLERYLARQAEKGRLAPNALPAIHARLHCATDFAALGGCKLVIEAVFENLELKRQIFAQIEANVSDTIILASNTSCLRLAEIATALRHRSRFCGMHYFSPAEINPVVELVSGPDTADTVIAAVQGFLRQTGKEVVSCSDQYGFALNRFFCPYTNEAVHLLDEG